MLKFGAARSLVSSLQLITIRRLTTMASIQASWRQIIDVNDIRRSSQVASVAQEDLLVFGGEIKPRQPVDNKIYRIPLDPDASRQKVNVIEAASAPSPRVGSASTTLNGKTYLFSGRGGEAMAPIEENGVLNVLDTKTNEWSVVKPADGTTTYPPARSYHAMTSDNDGLIFIHAGCPEKGRLSDLWSFNVNSRQWTQYADAPGPARGGTSIAWLNGKLYRMNGFDGKNEQGFALDVYDPKVDSWSSKTWDLQSGPPPRSVSTLLTVHVGRKDLLVTMFGECDPSSLGHQGAGRFLDDVWAYDVAEDKWSRVEAEGKKPIPRGWFAADTVREKNAVVMQGGLAEDNTRIGDVWLLAF